MALFNPVPRRPPDTPRWSPALLGGAPPVYPNALFGRRQNPSRADLAPLPFEPPEMPAWLGGTPPVFPAALTRPPYDVALPISEPPSRGRSDRAVVNAILATFGPGPLPTALIGGRKPSAPGPTPLPTLWRQPGGPALLLPQAPVFPDSLYGHEPAAPPFFPPESPRSRPRGFLQELYDLGWEVICVPAGGAWMLTDPPPPPTPSGRWVLPFTAQAPAVFPDTLFGRPEPTLLPFAAPIPPTPSWDLAAFLVPPPVFPPELFGIRDPALPTALAPQPSLRPALAIDALVVAPATLPPALSGRRTDARPLEQHLPAPAEAREDVWLLDQATPFSPALLGRRPPPQERGAVLPQRMVTFQHWVFGAPVPVVPILLVGLPVDVPDLVLTLVRGVDGRMVLSRVRSFSE